MYGKPPQSNRSSRSQRSLDLALLPIPASKPKATVHSNTSASPSYSFRLLLPLLLTLLLIPQPTLIRRPSRVVPRLNQKTVIHGTNRQPSLFPLLQPKKNKKNQHIKNLSHHHHHHILTSLPPSNPKKHTKRPQKNIPLRSPHIILLLNRPHTNLHAIL